MNKIALRKNKKSTFKTSNNNNESIMSNDSIETDITRRSVNLLKRGI